MTLFAEVARRFIIEKIQTVHDEATAKNQSGVQQALQRGIDYSKWKCGELLNFKRAVEEIIPNESDEEYKQAVLVQVGTIKRAIEAKRKEGKHPSGYTEQGLKCIEDFIHGLFREYQLLNFLDYRIADEPLFVYYKTIALYLAKRVQDAAEETQDVSFFSVRNITNNPRLSVKPAFLAALDSLVREQLLDTQDNITGQRLKDEGFQRRKDKLANKMLRLLSHDYNELRSQHAGAMGMYSALLPDELSAYIAEARELLQTSRTVYSAADSKLVGTTIGTTENK